MPQQPDRLAVAIPGLYPTLNTLYRWGGWPLTVQLFAAANGPLLQIKTDRNSSNNIIPTW